MVLGLKVVKDNGEQLDWMTVVFRELIGRFISNTFLKIPYLIVIFTPRHKGIHDFVADTTVVHEHIYEQVKEVQLVKPVQTVEQEDLLLTEKTVNEQSETDSPSEMQDFEKNNEK